MVKSAGETVATVLCAWQELGILHRPGNRARLWI